MNFKQDNELQAYAGNVDLMRSLSERKRRTTLPGKEFLVESGVFHPDIALDIAEFMNKEILKVIEEEIAKNADSPSFDFLEVGCGAGYTAIFAALASGKCRVWATDINEAGVRNTIANAKLHGVEDRVKAVVADVCSHEEVLGRKFDVIYWNAPWGGQSTEPGTQMEPVMKSFVDPGYQSFRRYLSDARGLLKPTGRLFIVFSFSLGSEELFRRFASETGWRFEIRFSGDFFFEVADEQHDLEVNVIEFFNKDS